jgi:hypothetical protein
MNRREKAAESQKQYEQLASGPGVPFGSLPLIAPNNGGYGNQGGSNGGVSIDGGGFGVGLPGAQPATGQGPAANPFIIPKATGLNVISQTYPSNYFLEWNTTTWRYACDQAIKQGYTLSYATLTSWTFESSAFVQMLFEKLGDAMDEIEFYCVDKKGNKIEAMQEEFCDSPWQMELRKEILFAFFWGFLVLNFDPLKRKVYKYPMQEVDPINRMLKSSTFAFYDGINCATHDNLLFVQHSTNYEKFLGWMQPITRAFIMMNQTKSNWVNAGLRLAFPVMTVGYPQNDGGINGQGEQINRFKIQAEDIAANIDPSKAIVYPYTLNSKGEIQKSVEVGFEETKAGNNMYKIYSEFNEDEKNEIRELILGGTLSSSGSKSGSGSRSLGEVHERMFKAVVKSKLKRVVAVLNDDYIPKLSKFYTGLPDGWKYEYDRAEQLTFEEMTALSSVVTANGKRLTDEFFEANGVAREYIEEAPTPPPPPIAGKEKPSNDPDPAVNAANHLNYPVPNFTGSKKKYS